MPKLTTPQAVAVPRAEELPQAARYRYWGDTKPPENRADIFRLELDRALGATGDAAPSSAEDDAAGATSATLRIYGPIDSWGGWWGISAADVAEALDSLPATVTSIVVRVNSPGGECWEALAIINLLRAWNAASDDRNVTTVVDGVAASAGSIITTSAGDRAVMSPGTQLMVHDAWCYAMGDAAALAKTIEMLDSVSDSAAALYAEKAGGTVEEWRDVMRAETWYTALEGAAAGLVDAVAVVADAGPTRTAGDDSTPGEGDDESVEDSIRQRFDLSLYDHAPAALTSAPKPPAASAPGSTTATEEDELMAFDASQLTTMRQSLGLPETADEATIVAAMTEALNERAEVPSTTATVVPPGMAIIDESALEALRAQAASGQAARDQQLTDHRERVLAEAVKAGKFAPARVEHFRTAWDADPEGTEETVNKLAAGVIPVDERGHDATANSTTSSAYDELYGHLDSKGA